MNFLSSFSAQSKAHQSQRKEEFYFRKMWIRDIFEVNCITLLSWVLRFQDSVLKKCKEKGWTRMNLTRITRSCTFLPLKSRYFWKKIRRTTILKKKNNKNKKKGRSANEKEMDRVQLETALFSFQKLGMLTGKEE